MGEKLCQPTLLLKEKVLWDLLKLLLPQWESVMWSTTYITLYVVTSERSWGMCQTNIIRISTSCHLPAFYPASNTWEEVTEMANCGCIVLLYSLDPLCIQMNVEL